MSKFSVKKPLTVFVAVIAILVLGVVAYTRMTPDLLPNMDFPYIIVVTTYPGASPEKVEAEVTKPMEQSMSTLEHIKNVSSNSNENYSMVLLEFEESVNMDTIGVDIQQSITALSAGWDDMVSAPYVLKINPSMLPIEVAAVAMDGMDTVELTAFLNDTLMNKLEGITGVARISTSGEIKKELHVILDQKKIDEVNKMIADAVNGKLDEAEEELRDKKKELEDAKSALNGARAQLDAGKDQLASQMAVAETELNEKLTQATAGKMTLDTTLSTLSGGRELAVEELNKAVEAGGYESADQMREDVQSNIASTSSELETAKQAQEQLNQTKNTLDTEIDELDSQIAGLEAEIAELPDGEEKTQKEVELAAATASRLAKDAERTTVQGNLDAADAQVGVLNATLAGLNNALAPFQMLDGLDKQIAEMTQQAAGLDAAIGQMKDAQKMMSEKKTAGLVDMSNGIAQIAAGSASIEMGLTQIDSGFDTIADSRESALAQADLNHILTMDMISNILRAQNFAMPAGYVEQDGISYMVSVGDNIEELRELQNLLLMDLGMDDVDPIHLSDVAEIMMTDNRNETYARLDGQESIVLTFEKQSTYSTAGATNNISARFRQLESQYPGLHFVALMDQGDYIYMIVENIMSSLLLGSVFAIIVLFLFLRDLRPTFITLCSIPLSVVFAVVLMYFSGVTINMISLSGLAVSVGMLVDNSVVVIENIYRLRSKGANAIQAAVSGAGQVAGAVTASTLTTVCVFLPIVFVEGITRQLFTDLALTMTYSLMASLIVSLTLVPAMASGMLRSQKEQKENGFFSKMLSGYDRVAGWSLDHKLVILGASVVLLAITGMMSLAKGFIFMPKMDMPSANVEISMPEDCTMEEAVELADEVLARIATVEGIETAGARMSSGGMSLLGGGGGGGSHDVTVYITLSDETASGDEVGKQIVALCEDMPCEVTSSSAMMDMSMLTGSGISMEIYSDDMDKLQTAAKRAADALREIPGVTEVSDGLEDAAPALHIRIDRNKAMSKGITVAQIFMELSGALSNSQQGQTLEISGDAIDIIIERQEEKRLDVDTLEVYKFTVDKQDGEKEEFKLKDIARLEETTSLSAIGRKDQRRYLTVSASAAEGYNITLLTNEAEAIMEHTDLGSGVTYDFTGESESIMEAIRQLFLMLVLGILLVYLVMVAQFQSLKSPFIVMFTIPLAFTGGFLALLLCGMEVSVISLIGFVMLTGIIVNNGIVLVDYINQLRREGIERRAAILEAGRTRMRPILMTSITTILGLIDMAVRKSAGTALMQPMAVVCIGGLVYATLMTLLVVPCIYDMMNKKELRNVREEDLELLNL